MKPIMTAVLFMALVVPSLAGEFSEAKMDGHAWLKASPDYQLYFLYGEEDCYTSEVHKGAWPDEPDQDRIISVSTYYKASSARQSEPVLTVFRKHFKYHFVPTDREKQSNEYGIPHGTFNGDLWRGLDDSQRSAFVGGFLACKATYLSTNIAHDADYYAQKITVWYGVGSTVADGSLPNVNPKTVKDPIAEVLNRLLSAA